MSARWTGDEPGEQRLRRKRDRPQGRRRIDDLAAQNEEDIADDTVRRLVSRGLIDEVVAELKSGKEATAYVARSVHGSVLLKIYRDLDARSFKNDRVYREGQVILDQRAKRAMESRSRAGLQMLQHGWVMAEYAHLWTLWRAGLNVPEPLAGPRPDDYAETVPAVLMRLVGTEDHPAPRVSDAPLTPHDAAGAWEQSVSGLAHLLRLGFVHGDYSTYNLLWWENTVTIIDFPQLVTRQNPNFRDLLTRDVHSLVTSFRKHGLHAEPDAVLRDVQRRSQGPAPEPRLVLP
ncbi:RIO kinase 1 [Deinococcus metalli]|uniref:non-specific serine/threonine protein kinase n=1 Tax=Deinococcus metalli TaxID=1141878 RepID=A0A7W8KE04_9DEIO|nr:RIO1 family regulatory kinase/ATPase [Deinococcus metalli]MBB5376200.1 RIO kinase 1 [Deinococcus metalli]GHF40040.1 serine/threonine protein kinase [Deinococcus metalli]